MIRSLLARHLVYPLHERIMKRPTFGYLSELENSQWLTRDGIEKLQEKKLTDLLKLACTHTPWHRERILAAGIDPGGPVTLDDLRALPVMDKQDASAHGEQMIWHAVPGGAFKYNTGGSSGQPLIFHYGRRRQASDAAPDQDNRQNNDRYAHQGVSGQLRTGQHQQQQAAGQVQRGSQSDGQAHT